MNKHATRVTIIVAILAFVSLIFGLVLPMATAENSNFINQTTVSAMVAGGNLDVWARETEQGVSG